ncbi:vacuolar protein sorting-associated protein 13D-like [Diaphorina citri]|uniref:Vacuolar protein sorting-associated protein 13D-like n=1 Tax=Diaphorina citri TaxID=121845 RepID=A0A3Q0IXB2_DIACI|nr:vacuolar protein sorting-associated protein 13D-like [Diaphorina citri]
MSCGASGLLGARLGDIQEEDGDAHVTVSPLDLDPALRARMLAANKKKQEEAGEVVRMLKVSFELPNFVMELKADLGEGEQGLVELSLGDLIVQYDKSHVYETNIQMSLRSLIMEDLLKEPDSKHRCIVVSNTSCEPSLPPQPSAFLSTSCPDVSGPVTTSQTLLKPGLTNSLPDHLETETVFGATHVKKSAREKGKEKRETPRYGGYGNHRPQLIYSTVSRNQSEYELLRIDKLYSCRDGGKPVLHDTVIQLSIERETIASLMHESIDDLASDLDATGYTSSERQENFQFIIILNLIFDSDVPLLEFVCRNMTFFRNMTHDRGSCSCSSLSIHYYNRVLSGWEPFIEPWECELAWENRILSDTQTCRSIKATSRQSLNLNITSTLIDLYSVVKENWIADYLNPNQMSKDRDVDPNKQLGSPSGYRRRSPFVPFALYNNTGCVLKYCTLLTTTDNLSELNRNRRSSVEQSENWLLVMPDETVPFSFNEQTKRRHLNTHKLCAHQLSVRVEGWKPVDPVTVDKVGVYFRHAEPETAASGLSHARLVFEVTLDGTAKKLVTVRSSLLLHNKLKQTVEVKLEKPAQAREPTKNIIIPEGSCQPMPLAYTDAQLSIRPLEKSKQPSGQYFAFCIRPIYWHKITTPGDVEEEIRVCHSNRGQLYSYRFRAAIKRDKYPCDKAEQLWMQPAHTISLLSPILLVNLLPINLHYSFNDCVHGDLNKGQEVALYQIDVDAPIGVCFHLDNYRVPGGFTIAPGTTSAVFPVKLQDQEHRKLYLNAQVSYRVGTELKITVSAHYWILNKTALPLVFRQEGSVTEAAGQFSEHEMARMVEPLLFSFNKHDAPSTLVLRIGQSYKPNGIQPSGVPQWCQQLHLVPGIQVRKLKVYLKNHHPEELIFVIGIDIRPGRGRYSNTTIVTLTPHYQIHNKSSHKLEFAQKCFASEISNPTAQSTFLQAMPESHLAFHWPRLDKDQLLCVRLLDQPYCLWSGGFKVNKTDSNNSFHIILRDTSGGTYFLRCEIVLQRATYFIVFTDANTMPPPIRIDNFSKVPLQFYQVSVTSSVKQSTIRPNCTVPYAWDEPDKPHILTLVAPGNVSENYDLNKLGSGPGLTYENFIYIAFLIQIGCPFPLPSSNSQGKHDTTDFTLQQSALQFQEAEVYVNNLNLCIIDDCRDSDVPLLEFVCRNMTFFRNMTHDRGSCSCSSFSILYYNRVLSGWEPFIEPWELSFELPNFVMELKADLGEGEQGLVELSLGDLIVQYDKSHVYETNIQMSLRSLIMEDLLKEPDSKHRCIVVSNTSCEPSLPPQPSAFLSTSCPDVSGPVTTSQTLLKPGLTNSLPDHLETETVFGATHVKKSAREKGKEKRETPRYGGYGNHRPPPEFCPQTPPPSPREKMSPNMFREDNLVHINVLLYDTSAPRSHHSNVNRSIAVDFNSLDIVVNVESWVVVLDFFGISGADVPDASEPSTLDTPAFSYPSSDEMGDKCYLSPDKETITFQTEWDIGVKSLSLVLNKTEYEVARANVSALQCRMTGANYANLGAVVTLQGTIGSLSLSDLTPEFSTLYNQRFISSDLKLFVQRFSDKDRRHSRLYDTYLKLDLPCVIYTHTQRFVAELQAFLRHFQQLQKLLGVIRSSSQWMSLRSLIMEDLLKEPDSKHRCIVVSNTSCEPSLPPQPSAFLSTSCPDVSGPVTTSQTLLKPGLTNSLPDHLETDTVFGATHVKKSAREKSKERRETPRYGGYGNHRPPPEFCPQTPPPSPREKMSPNMFREDNLVHINVLLYDTSAPRSHHSNVNRSIAVDFNSLDIVVNVESWVVVLDFFGISGADVPDASEPSTLDTPAFSILDIVVNVESWVVVLDFFGISGADVPDASEPSTLDTPAFSYPSSDEMGDKCYLSPDKETITFQTEWDIGVKSLSLVLNKTEYEVARANVSALQCRMTGANYANLGAVVTLQGTIGSLSLSDLTPEFSTLYNQRFISSDLKLFVQRFSDKDRRHSRLYDTYLKLDLPCVIYTHTQRFVAELQAFLRHFQQLQKLLGVIRSSSQWVEDQGPGMRLLLEIHAASPIILVPVSSNYDQLLIADLGQLVVKNTFKSSGDPGTISTINPAYEGPHCLLDVLRVKLMSMDLYMGKRHPIAFDSPQCVHAFLTMNNYWIEKQGPALLSEKCQLKLQVERNLMSHFSKKVPDMSIKGVLSKLAASIDLPQYKLLRALLTYNIAVNDNVQAEIHYRKRSDLNKLTVLLNNMRLMAILDWWEIVQNFIMDNIVLSNIPTVRLNPASAHHVTPQEHLPFQMKLNVTDSEFVIVEDTSQWDTNAEHLPFQMKLNVTDSEFVIVEDTSQWDTNAVILKMTTIITYKSNDVQKPLCLHLNHCEMFSCILGMEDETALSIIDPVTVYLEINGAEGDPTKILRIHIAELNIRLSYHDMKMFQQMLTSLPKQTLAAVRDPRTKPANIQNCIRQLSNMGFTENDCSEALERCNGNLEEAALWLTRNALPSSNSQGKHDTTDFTLQQSALQFQEAEVYVNNLNLCIIDDCKETICCKPERLFTICIVLQRATYFIVFTDANTMPPPIRIDNFSKVPLQFYQVSVTSSVKQSTIRPNCTVPYAWDEPDKPHILTLVAPGNVSENYDLNKLGSGPGLTYENFIYIAFSGTFKHVDTDAFDPLDVYSQQLVLDVVDGSGQVLLNRKEPGKRSQLWRMSSEGQLQHEGSSPPRDSRKTSYSSSKIMVLDINGPAPQPGNYVGLCLRRPDQRRSSTQTWRFTEDGRLCCAHKNMCVQAKEGFFGLRAGNEAVLGPPQLITHQMTNTGIALETAVCRQKLRPGSGFLSLNVTTDGPTCVLKICDIKEINSYIIAEGKEWNALQSKPSRILRDDMDVNTYSTQFELNVHLPHGMGISLVSRSPPEELLFAQLTSILLDIHRIRNRESIHLSIQDIQVDNELFGAQCPTILYVCPNPKSLDQNELNMPCIQMSCDRDLPSPDDNMNVEIIQSLQIKVKPLSVILEEKLFLKVIAFTDYCIEQERASENTNDESEIQRIITEVASVHARRYYFGKLQLSLKQVKLSVVTSAMLPPDLRAIKKRLNLKLLKFEDASIDLQQFTREHLFETCQFILNGILKHYKNILKWQAYNILGSVDFLGNPVGLMNDLSDGVSGLFLEGSPMSLVKNVTHGLSNSAAKVTESLSDGLGKVILDEQHEEARQKIRQSHGGSGGDHIMAGLKGLGLGVLGGVTSVFRQTYEEGERGLISGFGRGLVEHGSPKPVRRVLDFASRDCLCSAGFNVRSSQPVVPTPVMNYLGDVMAYEVLMSGEEDLRIVISSEMLRIFTTSSGTPAIIFKHCLGDVYSCICRTKPQPRPQHYMELCVRLPPTYSADSEEAQIKRPRVICDSEAVASWVSQQINYARNVYQERQHTLVQEPFLEE